MIKTPEGTVWAKNIYSKARANYHPVSSHTIDELLKVDVHEVIKN
jgi:hypothetical protein